MVITLTYFPALDSPCISSLNLTLSPSINLFTSSVSIAITHAYYKSKANTSVSFHKANTLVYPTGQTTPQRLQHGILQCLNSQKRTEIPADISMQNFYLLLKFFILGIISIHFLFSSFSYFCACVKTCPSPSSMNTILHGMNISQFF